MTRSCCVSPATASRRSRRSHPRSVTLQSLRHASATSTPSLPPRPARAGFPFPNSEPLMPITIALPNVLARLADGHRTVEGAGPTLGDVVTDVTTRYPGLRPRLAAGGGEPTPIGTYYLKHGDIRFACGV